LAGAKFFHALGPGNQLAAGRENARDAYQVTGSNSGRPKCQFEAGKLFPVFPYTFGEKHAFGYEHSIPHLLIGSVFPNSSGDATKTALEDSFSGMARNDVS
jgi:hypothetical protein